ncbi:MAG: ABC transporter ATP-binding protein [Bacteroidales bacterium]|nr:ABC transporter ATP-binding protein [Bacteroidales bacterium]
MNGESVNRSTAGSGKTPVVHLLRPYKGLISLLVFFTLLGNGLNLIIPLIISDAIDHVGNNTTSYATVVYRFIATSFFIMIFSYIQNAVQTYTSEKVASDIRLRLSEKVSRQSYIYLLRSNPSRLLTILTSDVDSIKTFVSHAVSSIVSSIFLLIGATAMLLLINWKLALAILTIVPIVGSAFYFMLRKVRVLFKRSREVIDWLNRVINESILGAALIRILNSQIPEYRKFLEANTTSRNLGISILGLFAALIPFITFVSNLAMLTVLAYGGHLVISGNMTMGDFAAFNTYIAILIFPIIIIGFMSNLIAQANASYQRVMEVTEAPDPIDNGKISGKVTGNIEVQNVTVTFGEKPALQQINLNISQGTKTAIIGPTAAGKTQLLYLLAGLIKPDHGAVLFNGVNLDSLDKKDFYRQMGMVFQDSVIFNLSIRENIAFSEEIPEEILQKAIQTAELSEFIESLPDKLNTVISERGTSLSGGQKQRIMLARALALNPRILLLDDFTSRVDSRTEEQILKNINLNYPEMTLIAVSQKIESIEQYEQIILLMESEIIASGTHASLLKTCPEYIQIYDSQRSTNHYGIQA